MQTVTPRHLQTAVEIDIRQLAHLAHGYVPWCLRCIRNEQTAGTNPCHTEELGHKGRSMGGR